jgi:hypothetical protein
MRVLFVGCYRVLAERLGWEGRSAEKGRRALPAAAGLRLCVANASANLLLYFAFFLHSCFSASPESSQRGWNAPAHAS